MLTTDGQPTSEKLAFFDTNGFLVLEDFLNSDHVARLTRRLQQAVQALPLSGPAGSHYPFGSIE